MGITYLNPVDILDYTDQYTDFGNQGATNANENVNIYIIMQTVVMINVRLAHAHNNKVTYSNTAVGFNNHSEDKVNTQ